MVTRYRTKDLSIAAVLRAFGADLVAVEPGDDGRGVVELDLGTIRADRVREECARLQQLEHIRFPVDAEDVEIKIANTMLPAIFRHREDLKTTVLARTRRR